MGGPPACAQGPGVPRRDSPLVLGKALGTRPTTLGSLAGVPACSDHRVLGAPCQSVVGRVPSSPFNVGGCLWELGCLYTELVTSVSLKIPCNPQDWSLAKLVKHRTYGK